MNFGYKYANAFSLSKFQRFLRDAFQQIHKFNGVYLCLRFKAYKYHNTISTVKYTVLLNKWQ